MDWIWLVVFAAGVEECIRKYTKQAAQQSLHELPPPPQPRATVMMWVPLIVVAVIACIVLSYK